MKELTIYYSVQNGGDGSAYPSFMESRELAEWDQAHMYEGWGEDCSGSITVKSESEIFCDINVATKESYYLDKFLDYDPDKDELKEFSNKFFPGGFPKIKIVIEDEDKSNSKYYIVINVNDGKVVQKVYAWNKKLKKNQSSEEGRLELEKKINEAHNYSD